MERKKVYFIPPKLNRSYLLGGFKVTELVFFFVVAFFAFMLAFKGYPVALAVPAVLLVLHCRALPDGRNVKQALAMRWRYFKKDQKYSLQECGKRR